MIAAILFVVMQVKSKLKSQYRKLGSEAKCFQDSLSNGMLDQPITLAKESHVVNVLKNNKSAGSGSIVGELVKYVGKPMCEMFLALFNLVWDDEYAPSYWREVLIH